MKNNDMRSLLGLMRNNQFLIKEDDTEISNEDKQFEIVVTNINDNDKKEILDIINSIKSYRIFISNLEKFDEINNNMIKINGKYTFNNKNFNINMKIGGDKESSTIDIEVPRPLVFDANTESTLFDFYSLLYNKFKNELFDKCSSMLGGGQNE